MVFGAYSIYGPSGLRLLNMDLRLLEGCWVYGLRDFMI